MAEDAENEKPSYEIALNIGVVLTSDHSVS
jgi:hypothetical protein